MSIVADDRPVYRFVFDHPLNRVALRMLQEREQDVVHVSDVGLAKADDAYLFLWAIADWRIIITRNYRDFVPLVQSYVNRGEPFPGVLFYADDVAEPDAGAHVRALDAWLDQVRAADRNLTYNAAGWLR
jgi:predicted nuclease of predicted toxin-antitoxin system